jgi:hypothetical protein
MHQHGVALARRKDVDGIADEQEQLPLFEASVRTGFREEARFERASAEPHLGQVHGDAAQPCAEARWVAQLREAEVRAQQCFLHKVFRLVADGHALSTLADSMKSAVTISVVIARLAA